MVGLYLYDLFVWQDIHTQTHIKRIPNTTTAFPTAGCSGSTQCVHTHQSPFMTFYRRLTGPFSDIPVTLNILDTHECCGEKNHSTCLPSAAAASPASVDRTGCAGGYVDRCLFYYRIFSTALHMPFMFYIILLRVIRLGISKNDVSHIYFSCSIIFTYAFVKIVGQTMPSIMLNIFLYEFQCPFNKKMNNAQQAIITCIILTIIV